MNNIVHLQKLRLGRRVALASVLVSSLLASGNIITGLVAGSTSVVAIGFEFAGDVLASSVVLIAMFVASKPADANHPYGHGRFESVAALVVGLILMVGGVGICFRSLQNVGMLHEPPGIYAIWPLVAAIALRCVMSTIKFRIGRKIRSASLVGDAWNDAVDILSALAALVALALTLSNPARFLAADHYGGFAVGLIVIFIGLHVMRESSLELMDTMPEGEVVAEIKKVARRVTGVYDIEKCFARKAGLQYHIDLHLQVDPHLTVWESHMIAAQVRTYICEQLDWVADVLIHVEPAVHLKPQEISDKS